MSYFKTALTGLSWTAALRGSIRVLAIGKTAVLARLLLPEQFGAFGIAAMALALLEIVTETGINVFLLQEKGDFKEYIDTAWVVSIIRGILISILIIVAAPYISTFFGSPQSLNLLYLAGVIPAIRGFINPANIIFQKDLRFDREFGYRFGILIVEILATILIAWQTRSAISFVWGLIFSAVTEVILSFVLISPKPKIKFEKEKLKHVLDRGKWVTGFGIFDYIFTQGDNIAVGRLLGEAPLGIYRTSYSLSTMPVTEISEIFYKVMFPVLVKVSHDPQRLKKMVAKSVAVVILLMLFVGICVFIFADPLVRVLLGYRWIEAIPVIRVLAITGLFRGLSFSFNSIFVALEKQKYVTMIIFTSMLGLVITIVPMIHQFGIIGAAYASALGSIIAIPVALVCMSKTLNIYGQTK
jgi:lipopolysaccharide exporter